MAAIVPDGTPSSTPEASPSDSTSSSGDLAPQAGASVTTAVLALVNRARADADCDPLRADDALASAALTNSTLMAARGSAAVIDAAGSAAAVADGPADADAAVGAWLADPADSAHLLDCSLTTAGAGESTAASGPWWTLFLA